MTDNPLNPLRECNAAGRRLVTERSFLGHYTMEDMKRLHTRAENHAMQRTWCVVDFLSHASPSESMRLIQKAGVIRAKNLRPKSGHPLSPIANLPGVYLMSQCETDSAESNFGDRLLRMHPCALLRPATERYNYYFGDFYCFSPKRHFVTVVVCEAGSDIDSDCAKVLPKLKAEENEFFSLERVYSSQRIYEFKVVRGPVVVELFFAHDIVLNEIEGLEGSTGEPYEIHDVKNLGRRTGLRHNKDCSCCNFGSHLAYPCDTCASGSPTKRSPAKRPSSSASAGGSPCKASRRN